MRLATFLFHDVADDPSTTGFQRPGARRYTHTPDQFERHLVATTAGPAPVVAVDDLDDPTARSTSSEGAVLLTFDDGGASARAVAERLSEGGQIGHFFVTTSMIGEPTFVGHDDIRAIRGQGHRVGSHSDTHPDIFRDLTIGEMQSQWHRSVGILSDILGEPVTMASVPGGDISRRVLDSARAEELDYLFTSEPTTRPRYHGATLVVGRFCPAADMPAAELSRLARFDGWGKHLARRRLKTAVKRLGAPAYRRYVKSSASDSTPS